MDLFGGSSTLPRGIVANKPTGLATSQGQQQSQRAGSLGNLFGPKPVQVKVIDEELMTAIHLMRDDRDVPESYTDKAVETIRPYSYEEPVNSKKDKLADLLWSGLSFVVPKPLYFELARMSISSTQRTVEYSRYLTPAQVALHKKGYELFINPKVAADLNAFGRENDQKRLTGAEIGKLAAAFDQQFTFLGLYGAGQGGIFSFLVSQEFDNKSSKQYESKLAELHTKQPIGGMKGGGWNATTQKPTGAYWGITQMGRSTYSDVSAKARGWGVYLPGDRESLTFGQMLVAAYVLAIMRQPTLVALGIKVSPATVYINHNQGNGVWYKEGVKYIKASAWDGQSQGVKALLKRHGFARLG